jgi:hypothetical protein
VLDTRFVWDFGKNNFDIGMISPENSIDFNLDFMENCKYANNFFYNLEDERYIYTHFILNREHKTAIYDKGKQQTVVFSKFTEGVSLPPFLNSFPDGVFGAKEPHYLQLTIKPELLDSANRAKLERVKIEDNPVIIKYYFN